MERRTFLGAAAALAALPAGSGGVVAAEVQEWEDLGETTKVSHPTRDVWSSTEVFAGGVDEDATVSVSGYHYEGEEPSGVELFVSTDSVHITVDVTPERARELAADLNAAADLAATGERQ